MPALLAHTPNRANYRNVGFWDVQFYNFIFFQFVFGCLLMKTTIKSSELVLLRECKVCQCNILLMRAFHQWEGVWLTYILWLV